MCQAPHSQGSELGGCGWRVPKKNGVWTEAVYTHAHLPPLPTHPPPSHTQITPVLQRIATVGCPQFTTSEAWPHDQPLFQACVWAVLGNLANEVS